VNKKDINGEKKEKREKTWKGEELDGSGEGLKHGLRESLDKELPKDKERLLDRDDSKRKGMVISWIH